MKCKQPGCTAEIVSSSHGRPGRPKLYCPEHSTAQGRKARSRADLDRFPCGCKKSGKYRQCEQHQERADRIPWGNPDQGASGYAAMQTRATHRRSDTMIAAAGLDGEEIKSSVRELMIERKTVAVMATERIVGQWMTERAYNGARIPVIGQWDLSVDKKGDWKPLGEGWRACKGNPGFRVVKAVNRDSELVWRHPTEWPWADEPKAIAA